MPPRRFAITRQPGLIKASLTRIAPASLSTGTRSQLLLALQDIPASPQAKKAHPGVRPMHCVATDSALRIVTGSIAGADYFAGAAAGAAGATGATGA